MRTLYLLVLLLSAPPDAPSNPCYIARDQVVEGHDYALCSAVQVDGVLHGDLVTLANRVIVNGRVDGDVLAVAGQVVVNGTVGGSVRALAGDLRLSEQALLSGQYSDVAALALSLNSRAAIRGDVWFAGRQAALDGSIKGDRHLFLLPTAPQDIPNLLAGYLSDVLRDFLALLLIGLITLVIAPHWITLAGSTLMQQRAVSLLSGGLIFGLLFPLAALLLISSALLLCLLVLLSLGQLAPILGVLVAALDVTLISGGVFTMAFLARVIAAYPIGQWLGQRLFPTADRATKTFMSMVVGVLLTAALCNLPYFGLLLSLLMACGGLGALALRLRAAFANGNISPRFGVTLKE